MHQRVDSRAAKVGKAQRPASTQFNKVNRQQAIDQQVARVDGRAGIIRDRVRARRRGHGQVIVGVVDGMWVGFLPVVLGLPEARFGVG